MSWSELIPLSWSVASLLNVVCFGSPMNTITYPCHQYQIKHVSGRVPNLLQRKGYFFFILPSKLFKHKHTKFFFIFALCSSLFIECFSYDTHTMYIDPLAYQGLISPILHELIIQISWDFVLLSCEKLYISGCMPPNGELKLALCELNFPEET